MARARLRFPRLFARYLTIDARTLGLVRIYLGALLLTDLLRRAPYLRAFYSNDGLLPNHTILWRPRAEYPLSLFFMASRPSEAALLFGLCGVVFFALLVGYRTRLFQLLAFVCICSLHGRVTFFDDGSEFTTRLLAFWTLFLPLGARFSIDALRTEPPDARRNEVVSLAVTGILLQLALIYVFNALQKDGQTWREGSAVHYALHQDRIVTWLGLQLRRHLTPAGSRWLSWTALATEALLPLLILSPFAQRVTRRVAMALGIGLHVGFALLLNLGLFSANMVGFFLLLISARDWELLARFVAVRPHLLQAVQRIEHTVRAQGARFVGAWLAPPADVKAWSRAPWPNKIAGAAPFLREATVVVYMFAIAAEISHANPRVPRWMHIARPAPIRMLVGYPRLYQGWGMFAPDAPKSDLHVFVDAITVDRRHVDPLNELGSRVASTPLHEIPERLALDDMVCDYVGGIIHAPEYNGALQEWLFAYDQRTGHARDRIVSFEVWVIEDDSPRPGESRPRNVRTRLLFKAKR